MYDDNLNYQLPEHWTAEDVQFLSQFLQDLNEALLATYFAPLRDLWRERDRLPHLEKHDDQLELFPQFQPHQKSPPNHHKNPR